MRTDTGQVFRLEDYRPSDFSIPQTGLTFRLSPDATRVTAVLTIERRDGAAASAPLVLDGDGLMLKRIAIDGRELAPVDYLATPDQLTILRPPARFELLLDVPGPIGVLFGDAAEPGVTGQPAARIIVVQPGAKEQKKAGKKKAGKKKA